MPATSVSTFDWRHYVAVGYIVKAIIVILLIRFLPARAKRWCARRMVVGYLWLKYWTLAIIHAIARMA